MTYAELKTARWRESQDQTQMRSQGLPACSWVTLGKRLSRPGPQLTLLRAGDSGVDGSLRASWSCTFKGVSFHKNQHLFVVRQLRSVSVRLGLTCSPSHLFSSQFKRVVEYPFIQVRKAVILLKDEDFDEFGGAETSRVTILIFFALVLMPLFWVRFERTGDF